MFDAAHRLLNLSTQPSHRDTNLHLHFNDLFPSYVIIMYLYFYVAVGGWVWIDVIFSLNLRELDSQTSPYLSMEDVSCVGNDDKGLVKSLTYIIHS